MKSRFRVFFGLLLALCIILASLIVLIVVSMGLGGPAAVVCSWMFAIEILVVPSLFVLLCFTSLEVSFNAKTGRFEKSYRFLPWIIRKAEFNVENIELVVKRHERPEGDGGPTETVAVWLIRGEYKVRGLSHLESLFYGIKRFPIVNATG